MRDVDRRMQRFDAGAGRPADRGRPSITSHSSGPSQSALRLAAVTEVFGFVGSSTPSACDSGRNRRRRGAQRHPLRRRQHGYKHRAMAHLAAVELRPAFGAGSATAFFAALAIEALSLFVEEHRLDDLDLDRSVGIGT